MTKQTTVDAGSADHPAGYCAPAVAGLTSLRALFRAAAIASLAGTLGACGGGGGSPSPAPEPPPAPSPQPLPAVMSVPTPVGYDADHLAAFNRLNELRVAAGLGMLAQNQEMDTAAQAHVEWEVANDVFSHVETVGTIGFTGANWWDRDKTQGYSPLGGAEVMSWGYDPVVAVDGLVNVIYHRSLILEVDPVDVGIGESAAIAQHLRSPLVIDFCTPDDGSARSAGQTSQPGISGVVIWPLDGAHEVWTHMGVEEPNPVPDHDVLQLGTPASISVNKDEKIEALQFVLTEGATGDPVPTIVLSHESDLNGIIPPSFVGLIPVGGLKANTEYRVDFTGSITYSGTSVPTPYARTWRFTTRSVDFPAPN
jgi:hypothetical protein